MLWDERYMYKNEVIWEGGRKNVRRSWRLMDSNIEDASVGIQPIMDVNGDFALTCFCKVGLRTLRTLSRNQSLRFSDMHCRG